MVQSLTELGKILLHYSRKDFESLSKQILSKQIFQMLPSTLQRRNTFLFERLTTHHYTSTPFLTTNIQSSNRISDLSCNKEEFDKVKSVCESALKDSGHISSMSYNTSNTQNARRNRNRKIIWFNPPYSKNVKTNIGKLFIKLVRKDFPKNNKYH